MAKEIEISLKTRDLKTQGDLNKLRRDGFIPGVVYGLGHDARSVYVNENDFIHILHSSVDEHIIFKIMIDDSKESFPAVIKYRQFDPIKQKIIHLDFQRIDMDKEISWHSEFKVKGVSKGIKKGGVLESRKTKVEGKCLPLDYPKYLAVDITNLNIGDMFCIKDLSLPSGLTLAADPDEVILTVEEPKRVQVEVKETEVGTEEEAKEEGKEEGKGEEKKEGETPKEENK